MTNDIRPKVLVIGSESIVNFAQQKNLNNEYDCLTALNIEKAKEKIINLSRPLVVILNNNLDGDKNFINSIKDINGVGILVEKDAQGFDWETKKFRKFDSLDFEVFKDLVNEVFKNAKAEIVEKPSNKLGEYTQYKPGLSDEKQI
jgi:hypothetical protein